MTSTLKSFEGLIEGTHQAHTGSILSFSYTPLSQHKAGQPILLLLHGWPQTRFMWRYTIPPLVSKGHTLFVPDLPGYGLSTLPTGEFADKHDRRTVGGALLSAVKSLYGDDSDIILIGHDRGGRVAHRLAADNDPRHSIKGVMILDIAPYVTQWDAAADPRKMTSYFHWAFLPVMELSVPMIQAYGGARFCRDVMTRSCGISSAGLASLHADDSLSHYSAAYEREDVIRGAALDYKAGADEDWLAEVADRKARRKISIPTCVLYSEWKLGKLVDVEKGWGECVDARVLEVHGIGGDVGHYLPEEAPEETNAHIAKFLAGLGL